VSIFLILLLILVLAGMVYQATGSALDARRYPPPGQRLDVGGYRLHFRRDGEGTPTVVFESGIAASSLSWTPVQREVAKFTTVCSYDRAGLGWSDPSPSSRACAHIVGELGTLLEKASLPEPYVLVGHSFGGLVVRSYASRYPDRVAGVILVDPIQSREWSAPNEYQKRMLRGGVIFSRLGAWLARLGIVRLCLDLLTVGRPGIPRVFIKVFGPGATAVIERIVGEVRKLPEEILPWVRAMWCNPKCFESMASHLACLPNSSAELEGVVFPKGKPLRVISAGIHPPEYQMEHQALAGMSNAGKHLVASRSGHWIQLDQPETVVEAIREVVGLARRG
jgi:pimeloyl-ACP methyl ester carboxylesterase